MGEVIHINSLRKNDNLKKVEDKIEKYSEHINVMFQQMEEILSDIEDSSDICWFDAAPHQKEIIEGIAKLGLTMEMYGGWAKYY